jgi:hypothetical protein
LEVWVKRCEVGRISRVKIPPISRGLPNFDRASGQGAAGRIENPTVEVKSMALCHSIEMGDGREIIVAIRHRSALLVGRIVRALRLARRGETGCPGDVCG